MHNGAFKTIRDVVNHYDNPKESLESYRLDQVDLSPYGHHQFIVDRNAKRNKLRINLISIGEIRRGLNLTQNEKEDLINFLTRGLLDYKFHKKENSQITRNNQFTQEISNTENTYFRLN